MESDVRGVFKVLFSFVLLCCFCFVDFVVSRIELSSLKGWVFLLFFFVGSSFFRGLSFFLVLVLLSSSSIIKFIYF